MTKRFSAAARENSSPFQSFHFSDSAAEAEAAHSEKNAHVAARMNILTPP
ncbi:MAG: hypothetical protein AB1342_16205 [Pseudomonadota bacterium]